MSAEAGNSSGNELPLIRRASRRDLGSVTALAALLWPGHAHAALEREMAACLDARHCALFLALLGQGAAGFAMCGLRHDYVEGTHGAPVGYLEGIFVKEPYRRQGIALRLLGACEQWAREQKCAEFAGDCALPNAASRLFHLKAGFMEVNRIICFAKTL